MIRDTKITMTHIRCLFDKVDHVSFRPDLVGLSGSDRVYRLVRSSDRPRRSRAERIIFGLTLLLYTSPVLGLVRTSTPVAEKCSLYLESYCCCKISSLSYGRCPLSNIADNACARPASSGSASCSSALRICWIGALGSGGTGGKGFPRNHDIVDCLRDLLSPLPLECDIRATSEDT